jgi:hypothetical protein
MASTAVGILLLIASPTPASGISWCVGSPFLYLCALIDNSTIFLLVLQKDRQRKEVASKCSDPTATIAYATPSRLINAVERTHPFLPFEKASQGILISSSICPESSTVSPSPSHFFREFACVCLLSPCKCALLFAPHIQPNLTIFEASSFKLSGTAVPESRIGMNTSTMTVRTAKVFGFNEVSTTIDKKIAAFNLGVVILELDALLPTNSGTTAGIIHYMQTASLAMHT